MKAHHGIWQGRAAGDRPAFGPPEAEAMSRRVLPSTHQVYGLQRVTRIWVLRLMRAHGLLAHQRVGRAHGPKAHDGTITTEQVDVMWGSGLTSVMTCEG